MKTRSRWPCPTRIIRWSRKGRARVHWSDFPAAVSQAFAAKYDDWDITSEEPDRPRVLIEVVTNRWLFAG